MNMRKYTRAGFAWLELLLALALVALLAQMFPAIGEIAHNFWKQVLYYSDIRNYSWTAWGYFNALLAAGLFVVRFWPELKKSIVSQHIERRKRKRAISVRRERDEKKQALTKEREVLERLEESRHRRIY